MVTRRWLAGAVALAACTLPAHAGDGTNDIGRCLEAGEVWLLVVDADGEVLGNQCVGRPSSGSAALHAGGLEIGYGQGKLICTIAGHPERCPTNFDGRFWHYWHGGLDQRYRFSGTGADQYEPPPGSIEAWCYNQPGERRCTPPAPSILIDGVQRNPTDEVVDLATTHHEPVSPGSPTSLLAVVGVLAAGAAASLWLRRRRA